VYALLDSHRLFLFFTTSWTMRFSLTPLRSQTPPALLTSPVHARPSVPPSKSRYVNMYARQNAS